MSFGIDWLATKTDVSALRGSAALQRSR